MTMSSCVNDKLSVLPLSTSTRAVSTRPAAGQFQFALGGVDLGAIAEPALGSPVLRRSHV